MCLPSLLKIPHCGYWVLLCCRKLGIEPTADTYTVLMCEFAAKGDITGIEKVGDSV